MGDASDIAEDSEEKYENNESGEGRRILPLDSLALFFVCVNSLAIPEAVSLAWKLRWVIGLLCFLPFLVRYTYAPRNYSVGFRFAGILMFSSLILVAVYFVNNDNLREGLVQSEVVKRFVSVHPDADFPNAIAVGVGHNSIPCCVTGFFLLTLVLVLQKHTILGYPSLFSLAILSLPLTGPFVISPIVFPVIPVDLLDLLRPMQLVSGVLLFLGVSTLPMNFWSTAKRGLPASVMGLCVIHGLLCLWSTAQVGQEYFFSGVMCASFHELAIFTMICRSSRRVSPPAHYQDRVNHNRTYLIFTIFQMIDILLAERYLRSYSTTLDSVSWKTRRYEKLGTNFISFAKIQSVLVAYLGAYQLSEIFQNLVRKHGKDVEALPGKLVDYGVVTVSNKLPPVHVPILVLFLITWLLPSAIYFFALFGAIYIGVRKVYDENCEKSEDEIYQKSMTP